MRLEEGCLASQEIRGLIKNGVLVDSCFDESRVQSSSLDPTIMDEMFVLDSEPKLFRPHSKKTIYRSLLEIPKRRRQRVDISDGAEVKVGFNYLIPLEQRIRGTGDFRFLKSSPKSSIGRLFPKTRLLVDYNASFDEAFNFGRDRDSMMWLLFQPTAFNMILSPEIGLNQLRFVRGYDAQLTPREIVDLWESSPLMYIERDGKRVSADLNIMEALQIHADVEGSDTEGIVALRARKNPNAIDLRKKKEYLAEDYFEPVKSKGGVFVAKRGEKYLIASKEILDVPSDLDIELKSHSHQGIAGSLHEAGFIDNGFVGDLVFEITSEEKTDLEICDGTPIGELMVFRTAKSDKVYGKEIGSNYQFQKGPKVSKHFRDFDFKMAARNYAKLDRDVLVQDAELLKSIRRDGVGFEFISDEDKNKLMKMVEKKGFFHSRYDCEKDSLILQIIPYVLGFGPNRTIFSYVRSNNIEDYGDERLFGKHSFGLGGHINRLDAPNFIRKGIEREVNEEEARIVGRVTEPKLVGTLYQPDKPVDEVHFGLAYGFFTDGDIKQKECSIISGRMIPIKEILGNSKSTEIYETWSRVLIPNLDVIYDKIVKDI